MRSYWTLNRTRAIVAALACTGVLTGPVIADDSAFAKATDEVATYLIHPSGTHPGHMLPPLSDHLIVAGLNDDQFGLEENGDEAVVEGDDGTAKEYNRGYYAEPVQIVKLVLVSTTSEAIERSKVSDDGTARQYDRGYYEDPEMIVALIIVPGEDIEE
jgi:hypothetical protein